MVIVLLRNYVSKESPYSNGFVHTRVRAYIRSGVETKVFVLGFDRKSYTYSIDGVSVFVGDKDNFKSIISKEKDVTVCVHFIDPDIIDCIKDERSVKKVIVFVHGFEALHWYQRIFPYTFTNRYNLVSLLYYIRGNNHALPIIRSFLHSTGLECEFVTVSNWMKEQAEKTWKCKGRFKWHIIPNYIDVELFKYEQKTPDKRKMFLSIRPFTTGKYANDITAKLIYKLNKELPDSGLGFTWVGDGPLHKQTTKKVKTMGNVTLEKRMLLQREIPDYHKQNGIFICPTRQDAQGVSMCEAMASGLVPITLYNTAIPEFLPKDDNLICRNLDDMYNLATKLISDYNMYKELSEECSLFIREKCSYINTIGREIELFND